MQRPCCLQVLYHVPAKRSIPFAGLFIACSSWQSSLFREDRRSGIRAGDVARAGCHNGAGFRSVPSSFPQSDLSHEGTEPPGAHIRLSACAGSPAPAIIISRRQAASAFPALRAPAASEPLYKARRGYFINISLYIIVDTVVFLTPLSGTFEPAAVPKYLPFPGKRNGPRIVSMQGLFFIGSIHDEKRGRATLLFPVQFPAGSFSAHHDDLLGGRQQSHIFPSFMRKPVS